MPESKKFLVSSSPHIAAPGSVRQIMLEVSLALFPALLCGTLFFGAYALFVVGLAVGSCYLFERLFNLIRKKPDTTGDFSFLVTGLLLGLNLPPWVPFYVPIAGGAFAMLIVKMLFGGLGKNFANPAATARIFLLLCWSSAMTTFVQPFSGGFFGGFSTLLTGPDPGLDGVVGPTPLGGGDADLLSLFLGNVGGCIGETSALALLIGGIWLIVRRIIDWKIPLLVLASAAVSVLIFEQDFSAVLPALLSGGLMIGAFFMATDYATSPNTLWGTVIYAVFIGFMTVFFRTFSNYPEGMSFAILLGNILVPLLDKFLIPRPFGAKGPDRPKAAGEVRK